MVGAGLVGRQDGEHQSTPVFHGQGAVGGLQVRASGDGTPGHRR